MIIAIKDICAGDVIRALDGRQIRDGVKVTEIIGPLPEGGMHVHVEDKLSVVSPDRYLRAEQITVERPGIEEPKSGKPEPERPPHKRRAASRTTAGIKWVRQENGNWLSVDGAYEIGYDDGFITECEAPHPIRFPRRWAQEARSILTSFGIRHALLMKFLPDGRPNPAYGLGAEQYFAILDGKKGYLCPGDAQHYYGLWVAFDIASARVIDRTETFTDAAEQVAHHIETGEYWD